MSRRVLVVEDDVQLQVLAVCVLRTCGYEAEELHSARSILPAGGSGRG